MWSVCVLFFCFTPAWLGKYFFLYTCLGNYFFLFSFRIIIFYFFCFTAWYEYLNIGLLGPVLTVFGKSKSEEQKAKSKD